MAKITRALLSVTDKTWLMILANGLKKFSVEILSTSGTARLLKENSIPIVEVSDFTGFPEIMEGRVKTLHPKVHGGLLGVRDNPKHQLEAQENAIKPIDLLACNLYEFEKTIAQPNCTLEEAIEHIDIGGPAMIRSAAKNYRYVTVLTDPLDYIAIHEEMCRNNGMVSVETNARLAFKAFGLIARYDVAIANYLGRQDFRH